MAEKIINRVIDGNLIVSITHTKRIRIISGRTEPLTEFRKMGTSDVYFLPGRVLSPELSRPYLELLGER